MTTNLALASIRSTGSSTTRTFGDRFADRVDVKDYGAKGDGIFVAGTVSISSGSPALQVAGAAFTSADVGKMISVPGAGASGGVLSTTISGFTDSTHLTLNANAGTAVSAVAELIGYGTDDTAALNSAIVAAGAAAKDMFVPIGYYFHSGLTTSTNLTIRGVHALGSYVSKNPVPAVLSGSVLCAANGGNNGISVTSSALQINLSNISFSFQSPFLGTTGDHFNYTPTASSGQAQGLSYCAWNNVLFHGHDGNHYALNLTNAIGGYFANCNSFGGGAVNLHGTIGGYHYGNHSFSFLQAYVVLSGTANGINVTADAASAVNLVKFFNPIIAVASNPPISPAPTSSQYILYLDGNVTKIQGFGADLEAGSTGAQVQLGAPAQQNYWDWGGINVTGTINSPAWGTQGLKWAANTRTFIDTTSSGTVALAATNVFTGDTIGALSAVNFTEYTGAYFAPPVMQSPATASSIYSAYFAGSIKATGAITGINGLFVNTGTIQLAHNSTGAVTLGDGSSNGGVTIGGASNKVGLGTAPLSTSFNAIVAGTTAKSPINYAAGVAPTSPQNGDFWFDGTNFKAQVGGATKTFTLT